MYPDWVEVITPFEVSPFINLVQDNSSNPKDEVSNYLQSRFELIFNQSVSFDDDSVSYLIEITQSFHKNHDLVYISLKSFVYHTFMMNFFIINTDEARLLRYKLRKVLDPTAVY